MSQERASVPAERHESIEDLLHRSVCTPEQAARMLAMDVRQIYAACYCGDLKCRIVGNNIVSVNREDLIRWLRDRS